MARVGQWRRGQDRGGFEVGWGFLFFFLYVFLGEVTGSGGVLFKKFLMEISIKIFF